MKFLENSAKKFGISAVVSLLVISSAVFPAYALTDKDLTITQWDEGNFLFQPYYFQPTMDGRSQILGMRGDTQHPFLFTMGHGLSNNTSTGEVVVGGLDQADISGLTADLAAKADAASLATVATTGDYNDLLNKPSTSWTFATSSRSLTTGTGATGFQVSATQNVTVSYAVNIATVATLGAPAAGYITMEIAPTNSSNAADWYEVGTRCRADNTVGLLAVQSTQGNGCSLSAPIPAGYYVKLRSVTVSGTPTFTFVSGWETKQ
ncbi:MAG TPA: hypothetical protein PLI01_00335 [Nitrospira sp.]|nr:hypothetical protein [Nitrospira sp.]HNA25206.1 hypothetical protein [Nitrospira sp.]HNI17496.1 hypothetical protein [Nitrospira sp.]